MHKIMDYVCREMEDIERKVASGHKLSLTETQYLDMLAHIKKDLLTSDAMEGNSEDSSYDEMSRNSYRRGRDSMGRYVSRDSYDRYSRDDSRSNLVNQLKEMEGKVNDEESRRMLEGFIRQATNY